MKWSLVENHIQQRAGLRFETREFMFPFKGKEKPTDVKGRKDRDKWESSVAQL